MVTVTHATDRERVFVVAKRQRIIEQTIYTRPKRFSSFVVSDVRAAAANGVWPARVYRCLHTENAC